MATRNGLQSVLPSACSPTSAFLPQPDSSTSLLNMPQTISTAPDKAMQLYGKFIKEYQKLMGEEIVYFHQCSGIGNINRIRPIIIVASRYCQQRSQQTAAYCLIYISFHFSISFMRACSEKENLNKLQGLYIINCSLRMYSMLCPAYRHPWERTRSSRYQLLNGNWKFHWAKQPEERPKEFYKPGYDVSAWAEIPVRIARLAPGLSPQPALRPCRTEREEHGEKPWKSHEERFPAHLVARCPRKATETVRY